jgi:hypothetical protein
MRRTGSPFLGPRENLRAFTFVGPAAVLDMLRRASERIQISRHVIAALAIDEYLRHHYPESHVALPMNGEREGEHSNEE